jgi:8-oxo-dGTP diphosphatase
MIHDDNGNVLVQDRLDPNWSGITFPGGHVEEGESFTEAVIREVYEETGLIISSPQLCGIKDWYDENGRYIVFLYKANRFLGELASSDEGEVYWVKLNEMKNANLAKGMDNMMRVFLDDDTSEYFFYRENGEWKEKIM